MHCNIHHRHKHSVPPSSSHRAELARPAYSRTKKNIFRLTLFDNCFFSLVERDIGARALLHYPPPFFRPRNARCAAHPNAMNDRTAGLTITLLSVVLFLYYTAWTLVTPFIEPAHPVLRWFPPRIYAVLVPAYLGLCLVCVVAAFLGIVMLRHKPKSC